MIVDDPGTGAGPYHITWLQPRGTRYWPICPNRLRNAGGATQRLRREAPSRTRHLGACEIPWAVPSLSGDGGHVRGVLSLQGRRERVAGARHRGGSYVIRSSGTEWGASFFGHAFVAVLENMSCLSQWPDASQAASKPDLLTSAHQPPGYRSSSGRRRHPAGLVSRHCLANRVSHPIRH